MLTRKLLLNDNGLHALGVLDVDGLYVAVELLFGTLLVVTSPGDADAKSVRNALDTLLPDLLVQLGVEADIGGALKSPTIVSISPLVPNQFCQYVAPRSNTIDPSNLPGRIILLNVPSPG